MGLFLPPGVSRELQAHTDDYRAEVMTLAQRTAVCDRFNPELKAIDPLLTMYWFDENASAIGVMPARYNLVRDNEGAPPTIIPICGPNREFMEPNSGLFEWLRKGDMWEGRNRREREQAAERARVAAERARERERESLLEEARDRWNANFRTSVSLDRDARWSQNAAGARRRGKT